MTRTCLIFILRTLVSSLCALRMTGRSASALTNLSSSLSWRATSLPRWRFSLSKSYTTNNPKQLWVGKKLDTCTWIFSAPIVLIRSVCDFFFAELTLAWRLEWRFWKEADRLELRESDLTNIHAKWEQIIKKRSKCVWSRVAYDGRSTFAALVWSVTCWCQWVRSSSIWRRSHSPSSLCWPGPRTLSCPAS